MMSSTQLPKPFSIKDRELGFPILGYETMNYFLLDLDKQVSLEEVKKIALAIGRKYDLGDCLILHSSDDIQLTFELKPLQNYNLVFGRKLPWEYQQSALKELRESGIIGDIRYVEFREKEQSSTLRLSPKSQTKGCPKPIAYVKISGQNEGIREYLKMLSVGKDVEKFLKNISKSLKDSNPEKE